MANIRTWHTYLGILIAPSILFFALTGALQIFHLHEAHGDYQPPMLLEKLGRVHKDQVFAPDEHHEHAADHAPAGPKGEAASAKPGEEHEGAKGGDEHDGAKGGEEHEEEGSAGTLLLKWYFIIVALALTTSTCLGLWIGLTHFRHKRIGWVLLLIGILLPALLIAL
ncbi:MAG: hypothetical protein JOZ12_08890 [Sinobacteraceae bacterium]|nr:hypothetical protein [Nevskiaceae bacterium]